MTTDKRPVAEGGNPDPIKEERRLGSMHTRKGLLLLTTFTTLVLAVALPAAAAAPPAPWVAKDIGAPGASGSTDVDANGVWTIKGSGDDIFNTADNFQFAYQPVKGDASVSMRFLSMEVANEEWTKIGLMVRENDTAGSPCVHFCMTPLHGLHATSRTVQDDSTNSLGEVGPTNMQEANLYMRLQRAGNDVAGFYSRDGKLWSQAGFTAQTLPTLKDEALIGLDVTSHSDGDLATGKVDSVSIQPGLISVYGVGGCGGDKSVLVSWKPLKNAVGYNVYRGPAGATADKLVKMNTDPITGSSFTDNSDTLVNGTAMTYAVSAIFQGADGNPAEGLLVAAGATPVAIPQGFVGCSISEGANQGGAAFDAGTGQITIRGSGGDIWDAGDRFYFMAQPMDGDVQITVKALDKPTATNDWAKAGLMIRESLDSGARFADLVLTPANGLAFQWRPTANSATDLGNDQPIDTDTLKPPITIRLTRKGKTITAEYSTDDGKTFQSAGDPFTFEQDLPKTVYVGLAITAHDASQISEAHFSNLDIKKL
jgi:regulation of enolase protein 1 (concanavalin A-like superfamily)